MPRLPSQPARRAPQGKAATQRRQTISKTPLEGTRDVNKSELIEHIAKQADISKAAASRSLEALIGAVKTTLKKGGSVTVTGFGTFTAPKRAARMGRNPRTGAAIKIKAAKVPKFRPGKGLRDAL
jgi:DNA-binding protein HU-beta